MEGFSKMDKSISLQIERHKTSIRIGDKWNPMGKIKQNIQGLLFLKEVPLSLRLL